MAAFVIMPVPEMAFSSILEAVASAGFDIVNEVLWSIVSYPPVVKSET